MRNAMGTKDLDRVGMKCLKRSLMPLINRIPITRTLEVIYL